MESRSIEVLKKKYWVLFFGSFLRYYRYYF